jgi:hypothetical protein
MPDLAHTSKMYWRIDVHDSNNPPIATEFLPPWTPLRSAVERASALFLEHGIDATVVIWEWAPMHDTDSITPATEAGECYRWMTIRYDFHS